MVIGALEPTQYGWFSQLAGIIAGFSVAGTIFLLSMAEPKKPSIVGIDVKETSLRWRAHRRAIVLLPSAFVQMTFASFLYAAVPQGVGASIARSFVCGLIAHIAFSLALLELFLGLCWLLCAHTSGNTPVFAMRWLFLFVVGVAGLFLFDSFQYVVDHDIALNDAFTFAPWVVGLAVVVFTFAFLGEAPRLVFGYTESSRLRGVADADYSDAAGAAPDMSRLERIRSRIRLGLVATAEYVSPRSLLFTVTGSLIFSFFLAACFTSFSSLAAFSGVSRLELQILPAGLFTFATVWALFLPPWRPTDEGIVAPSIFEAPWQVVAKRDADTTKDLWAFAMDATGEDAFFAQGEAEAERLVGTLRGAGFDPAAARLLEVGAGIGRVTWAFVDRFKSVTASDIEQKFLAQCQDNCSKRSHDHSNLVTLPTIGQRLIPVPDRSFDVVFSFVTLQHCRSSDALRLISECARSVSDDGVVILQIRRPAPVNVTSMLAGRSIRLLWRLYPSALASPALLAKAMRSKGAVRLAWQGSRLSPWRVARSARVRDGIEAGFIESDQWMVPSTRSQYRLRNGRPLRSLGYRPNIHRDHWWLIMASPDRMGDYEQYIAQLSPLNGRPRPRRSQMGRTRS